MIKHVSSALNVSFSVIIFHGVTFGVYRKIYRLEFLQLAGLQPSETLVLLGIMGQDYGASLEHFVHNGNVILRGLRWVQNWFPILQKGCDENCSERSRYEKLLRSGVQLSERRASLGIMKKLMPL